LSYQHQTWYTCAL